MSGNGRVQKPNGSLQGLLSLGLQRAHHMFVILYWSKQIMRQAETEVLGKWTSSWKDLQSHGAKSMNSGKKSSGTIFAINLPPSFFLHSNISVIYLIINVVLEWLQPGFPSNYSRDNLCLLLPVTWSMTNLKPVSNKFFLGFADHTFHWAEQHDSWLLVHILGDIFFSLSPLCARMEVCQFSSALFCVSRHLLIFLMLMS